MGRGVGGVSGRSGGKGAYDQDALCEKMYVCNYVYQNTESDFFFTS